MSPDWSERPEAVPYSVLDDPQSLNLYGYVRNNPLSHVDADGHCWPLCTTVVGGAIGGAVGAVSNFYSQWSSNGHNIAAIDTQKVASAALGGAVSGVIAGATLGGSVLKNAIVGASANVAGGAAQRATSGDPNQHAVDAKQMTKDAAVGAASGIVGTVVAKEIVSSTVATPSGQSAVQTTSNPSAYDIVNTTSGLQPVGQVQLNINTAVTTLTNVGSAALTNIPSNEAKGDKSLGSNSAVQ
jgi:hypothetical protein